MNRYDFAMSQGDSLTMAMIATDEFMARVDLTGRAVTWGLALAEGGVPLVSKDAVVTDAGDGEFAVTLAPTDTMALDVWPFDQGGVYYPPASLAPRDFVFTVRATGPGFALDVAAGRLRIRPRPST